MPLVVGSLHASRSQLSSMALQDLAIEPRGAGMYQVVTQRILGSQTSLESSTAIPRAWCLFMFLKLLALLKRNSGHSLHPTSKSPQPIRPALFSNFTVLLRIVFPVFMGETPFSNICRLFRDRGTASGISDCSLSLALMQDSDICHPNGSRRLCEDASSLTRRECQAARYHREVTYHDLLTMVWGRRTNRRYGQMNNSTIIG
ncbi:hypothetical protein IW262DRAFT_1034701 [Armillaria fumosa]|nr:hypothetical protein IW262DRAFT_1034701 [Armillaria fumosa]